MISVRQETERETALVDMLRPRTFIFMETVMMIKLTRFQNQSQIVQNSEEQEALISLRDARKKLQHATKSRRLYPKGGGRARSTGKSIEELKKVTSVQSMWRHRSLGRRLLTACQKPQEEITLCTGQRKKSSVQERKI